MKRILSVVIVILIFQTNTKCFAQKSFIPKNSIGGFVGLEWNTISSLTGASYERSLFKREKITVGIKALHVFTYENGNAQILYDDFDGNSSLSALMATAHYFTGRDADKNEGFFLQFGIGGGMRKYTDREIKRSYAAPCSELALGWQFYMGQKTTLALHTGLLFGGEGGISFMKLSVGF